MTPRTDPRRRRRRRRRRPGRLLLAGAVVGGAVGLAGALGRRRPLIDPVADDLRTPLLYLPLELRGARALQLMRSLPAPPVGVRPGVEVDERRIPGADGRCIRALVYEHPDRPRPGAALVWIHGGGMVLGRPEQGHALCSRWAAELGLLVVSVDYRLAPEDPFPAGLEDCYDALSWVHAEAEALGVDPTRVAVGGDSAGGGLSAAVSLLARDRGGPPIAFQLLEYPMLDDRSVLRGDHAGRGAFVWTPASNRFAWTAYLGGPPQVDDDRVHAAPARADDLSGLPPAWVGVGDLDLFHDEDVAYAERLEAAGVPTELLVVPGMYHGADSLLGQAPTSRAFRDAMTEALARGLGVDPTGAALAPG